MIQLAAVFLFIITIILLVASNWLAYLNHRYPGRPKLWRRP